MNSKTQNEQDAEVKQVGWIESFKTYLHPRVRSMLFLGFSAGLPYYLVFGTLSRWLREAGIERSTIGFLSWIMLAYGFKVLWSPIVDRIPIPFLTRKMGRRRSWMFFAQMTLMACLAGMAFSDPQYNLTNLALFALFAAFASATQDIAIDAYRIEAVKEELQAAMAATYMIGYRVAMILASAGAFYIAAAFDIDEGVYRYFSWMMSYLAMAVMVSVGIVTTFLVSEPEVTPDAGTVARENRATEIIEQYTFIPDFVRKPIEWIYNAVISPFLDFLVRYRWHAVLILLLVGTYRISDIVLGVIANVFYVDKGFSKEEVATVSYIFGTIMTLLGASFGGVFTVRYGVMKILFLGALLSAATNILFSIVAAAGKNIALLTAVVSADNLSAGIATAAFIAYLSSLTNISYTATQYALFSSLMVLIPKFIGGFSGVMVDHIGYEKFFIITAAMGIPVLILVLLASKHVPSSGHRKHAG
jgi:PAT family beta-lactamase induction signal transducer AmpG